MEKGWTHRTGCLSLGAVEKSPHRRSVFVGDPGRSANLGLGGEESDAVSRCGDVARLCSPENEVAEVVGAGTTTSHRPASWSRALKTSGHGGCRRDSAAPGAGRSWTRGVLGRTQPEKGEDRRCYDGACGRRGSAGTGGKTSSAPRRRRKVVHDGLEIW
ncbi:putative serine/arginine repetitive matrix protein 1 isoform X1 [Iris pallida]|uniref:Serine/arginine repetitive matrix protein 1 isoform X1 n=1 Tax=Iris pallida TaxID=29817 RepID=A0AAX6GXM4_IRIPA|nr:putative serine/arginine repetitive matrix protein 1 isoform X1 [Iris pallida]